jgi:hypothetical protein
MKNSFKKLIKHQNKIFYNTLKAKVDIVLEYNELKGGLTEFGKKMINYEKYKDFLQNNKWNEKKIRIVYENDVNNENNIHRIAFISTNENNENKENKEENGENKKNGK